MGFTTAVFTESQDTAGELSFVAALPDQHLTTSADDVLVPDWASKLGGVFVIGATVTAGQVSSPELRKHLLLDIEPINVAAEPVSPTPFFDMFDKPISLMAGEGLRALVAEEAVGAEQDSVVVFLMDEIEAAPDGEIFSIKATSATTLTPYDWTLCSLTLSQQLEAGRYAIVGMRAVSAGAIAARLVIPGEEKRPGVIAFDTAGDVDIARFRRGNLGKFGEFDHRFIPQVEFFSVSADTAETVILDIVKVE